MTTDNFSFESLAEFIAQASQPPSAASMETTRKSGRGPSSLDTDVTRADWFGTPSFEAALELLTHGWPDGVALMSAAREAIKLPDAIATFTPAPVIADDGDEVLVDRFLDGESDHWLQFPEVMTPAAGRVVSVIVNIGGNCDVTAETYRNRGAAALAVIDALESAGARVEVTLRQRSKLNKARLYNFAAVVKRAEDVLELDRMAFLLMHASVQRRFMFRLREQSAGGPEWIKGSYGHSVNIAAEEIAPGALYFPTPARNLSQAAAVELAQAMVKQYTATATA